MEQWKPIPGYEGLYDASNLGNIRSTPGKITSNAQYDRRVWNTRVMKLKWKARDCGKKDARVCLWKDGKEHTHLVARLVALTWCDGYSAGMTVNHIDGDTENNHPENLEWVTIEENVRHAFDTGLCSSFQYPVMLIDKQGEEISFRSMAEASRFLGHNDKYISDAMNKRRNKVYDVSREPYTVARM